eukprot:1657928-Amphidinium_carterae.1
MLHCNGHSKQIVATIEVGKVATSLERLRKECFGYVLGFHAAAPPFGMKTSQLLKWADAEDPKTGLKGRSCDLAQRKSTGLNIGSIGHCRSPHQNNKNAN